MKTSKKTMVTKTLMNKKMITMKKMLIMRLIIKEVGDGQIRTIVIINLGMMGREPHVPNVLTAVTTIGCSKMRIHSKMRTPSLLISISFLQTSK